MRKRRANYRVVKRLRNYTTDEAARLLQVHKNTVRAWVRAGLPVCDGKRPALILGVHLSSFLQARQASRKQTCKPGELYCLRCRAPRMPAGNMVDYADVNEKVGNLTGICPICESMMNQRVNRSKLGVIQCKLDVAFPLLLRRLSDTGEPSVNSDFRGEASTNDRVQCPK